MELTSPDTTVTLVTVKELNMSKKIVINNCFGGFGLSEEARGMLGRPLDSCDWEVKRDDPKLVEVVEKLGCGSYGRHDK